MGGGLRHRKVLGTSPSRGEGVVNDSMVCEKRWECAAGGRLWMIISSV
jgi:hypothetical protein